MKLFLNLLRKEWSENAKYFLYYYLVFTIIFIGLVAYVCYQNYLDFHSSFNESDISVIVLYSYLVGGIIFVYLGYYSLFKKERIVQTLTLPVSNLQKWLCFFLIYSILFFVVNFIWSDVLQILAKTFTSSLEFVEQEQMEDAWSYWKRRISSSFAHGLGFLLLYLFFFVQSVLYVGLFHFKRYGIIKTLFIAIVIGYLFFEYTNSVPEFFGGYGNAFGILTEYRIDEDEYFAIHKYYSSDLVNHLNETFMLSVPIILFITSYFKLKERELR
ncbi:hypothetical protein [Capnocytophaga canimorsus]|uniref:hypothetical protein n=1 Tax=Capnocytophaga canimorsus TaxID=28188 RepID=UPI0037D40CF0